MKINILLLVNLLLLAHSLPAQEPNTAPSHEKSSIHLGYYTPFGNQIGVRAGINHPITSWTGETKNQETRIHSVDITPRLAYFVQPDVQQNFFLDLALEYKWFKVTKTIPLDFEPVGIRLSDDGQRDR